jgi:hypothetical protein
MSISELVGKTLKEVKHQDLGGYDGERIDFITEDDEVYRMTHFQSCCESVYIEDINGDLQDLVGTPILHASEDSNETNDRCDLVGWTFYNIRTIKGSVNIRWNGSSNGYYSIDVDFSRVKL